MIKVKKFYDVLNRNAELEIDTTTGTTLYCGTVRSIPDEYDDLPVADFHWNHNGRIQIVIEDQK